MHTSPFTLITVDDDVAAGTLLERLGLMRSGEEIAAMERAGEGNMNAVFRICIGDRSVILKQSRPWVEKYPQIAAPADRILAEIDFYHRVESVAAIANAMPRLLAADIESRAMVLEDLGSASDYSDLYERRAPNELPLEEAIGWLAKLHAIEIDRSESKSIGSLPLRQLNHAHMYVIPLESPSAISLDAVCEGLEDLADRVRENQVIRSAAESYGDLYLEGGDHLLHGDFYPGSWLRTKAGLRVIDPEFAFAGPAEFDLAILAAHRVLIGGDQQSSDVVAHAYVAAGGKSPSTLTMRRFAGLEIIRRIIGVAQLPLVSDLQERTRMIDIAIDWVES